MKPMPRSIDEIRGLRIARWVRESTDEQYERYGPASQLEQQDRFIERYGLVDTGKHFEASGSGMTVWRSSTMNEMLAEARRGTFDLLLVGYSDRWQRNLRRTLELLEDHLHPAGVALVMCDRRVVSSDPHDWEELVSESMASERYSHRLGERITDGHAAKFAKESDPAGHAPLGFKRLEERPHTLYVDPETIGIVVALFERYALGTVSAQQLAAETGLKATAIRMTLINPIYNGWVRRNRGPNETRRPAAWRLNPPVSDDLWARVEDVRRAKTRGGGPRNRGRVDLLAGLLECVCGRRVRSDGTFADGRHRKFHPAPCADWGPKARLGDETWEAPILAQVGGLELDNATIAQVVAALGSTQRPIGLDRARLKRQMHEIGDQHVDGKIGLDAYVARLGELRGQIAAADEASQAGVPADRAVAWLRALGETWQRADLPQEKADLLHAIYERVVVAGPTLVSARLTPAANAHGLALALPQVVMARPTGVGRAITTHRLPIEGREEWEAAAQVRSA